MTVLFLPLWTKVREILGLRTICGFQRSSHLSISCFFRRHSPLKLPISCEVAEQRRKLVVFGPPIFRGKDRLRQILDTHFQIALTSEHVADSVAFRSVLTKKGR